MKSKKRTEQQQRVLDARRDVEYRLSRVRDSLDRETRWVPKGEKWLLPLMAFAVGLAFATKGSAPDKSVTGDSADDQD